MTLNTEEIEARQLATRHLGAYLSVLAESDYEGRPAKSYMVGALWAIKHHAAANNERKTTLTLLVNGGETEMDATGKTVTLSTDFDNFLPDNESKSSYDQANHV